MNTFHAVSFDSDNPHRPPIVEIETTDDMGVACRKGKVIQIDDQKYRVVQKRGKHITATPLTPLEIE